MTIATLETPASDTVQPGQDVVVIYHASCHDGFCCAWLLHKIYPGAEFIACHHGMIPLTTWYEERDVYIVDFSFDRPTMERMIDQSKSLVCLDHHRTAEERLAGLPGCYFDGDKSGARMVWDYFRDHWRSRIVTKGVSHWLVDYTEDRDLWRWSLPLSREVNAALRMFPFDFEVWDSLELFKSSFEVSIASPEKTIDGQTLVEYFSQRAEAAANHATEILLPVGSEEFKIVPCTNVTDPNVISDAGHALATSHESSIGMTYFFDGHGFRFSIRSIGDVDAGRIAEFNGGGGHKHAAGFYRDSFLAVFQDPEFEVKDDDNCSN